MKSIILLAALVSTLCFNLRQTKQNYDSYVFAVQWANGYCAINNCGGRESVVPKNEMSIHGLWPSLKSGSQLNACTDGVKITDTGSALFQNMNKYWPSFSGANTGFWEHEYNKHGYCMAEEYGWSSYESYFQFVIDLHFRTYKDLIKNCFSSTQTISYNDFVAAIRKRIPNATINMKCAGKKNNRHISELYFYLEKNFSPSTTSRFSKQCDSGKLLFK